MTPRDGGIAVTKRLAVSAVVALVVTGALVLPALTDTAAEREPLETSAYDTEALAATPIPAVGDVDPYTSPDARGGTVVVDATHSNRFDRPDIEPLVEELTALGYDVRIHDGDRNLYNALTGASAFVVIDPADPFERNEATTVRTFTRNGGHLLLVGEPTRKAVSGGFGGVSVSDRESALTTLAARYDMGLGTAYLTNTGTNGGNHKHVVAAPTAASAVDADRVVLFTAAAVHARGGTVLLRAAEGTREAGSDGSRRYPVAVRNARENVVLVGDSTVLRADRVSVADNEAFAAFLVDFLVSGEPLTDGVVGDPETGSDAATDEPTRTAAPATPSPSPTPTPSDTPTPSPPTDTDS